MGNCGSENTLSPEEKQKQSYIESELRQNKKSMVKQIKILLLGTGDSGKTTITKQIKIIHLNGFSDKERHYFRDIIHSNIFTIFTTLITGVKKLNLELQPNHQSEADEILNQADSLGKRVLSKDIVSKMKTLMQDPAIQAGLQKPAEIFLMDSAPFLLDNLDRYASDNFIPQDEDILRVRVKTTGVTDLSFKMANHQFCLVDVGGQRGERKKWIHSFEGVRALLFCIAASEYDMKLVEDAAVNRMHESIKLFDEVCNSRWFKNTAIILFLNKRDLFEKKIKEVDLNVCFPDYTGGCDYNKGIEYIKQQFLSLDSNDDRTIYVHVTCATDTNNIQTVFNAVKDIVLQEALEEVRF